MEVQFSSENLLILNVILAFMMFGVSLSLTGEDFRRVLKRPDAPIVGLLAQFVLLPAATIGRHATVGPVSLVMRGESVPDKTVWIGNPIGPWTGPGGAA